MKSVVVYDSYFGNTEMVAKTIQEVFQQSHNSKLIHISEAYDLDIDSYDLIVIGSPTRYYKPTEPIVALVREVRAYSVNVGFFDTRMDAEGHWLLGPVEKLLGFAVDTMVSLIENGEATMDIEPLGVYVKSTKGPIRKTSVNDIQAWAKLLLASIAPAQKQTAVKAVAKPKAAPKAAAKPAVKAVAKPKAATTVKAKPKVATTASVKAKAKATTKPNERPSTINRPPIKGAKTSKPLMLGDGPVYVVDLSSGTRINLQTMTVAELKQFAKDNFNKGYEDLNRSQLILLNGASAIDIKEQARQQGIKNYSKMRKSELIKRLTSSKK